MQDQIGFRAPADIASIGEVSTGQEPDEVLIRRYVCDGDEEAFATLFGRHRARIRRLLFGLLKGNREDIQDVEQEILIALCRNLAAFRNDSSFETYLYRFAHNRAVDYIRSQSRQRRLVEALGERSESPEEVHAAQNIRRERSAAVTEILAGLTDQERLLITLKELEGLPIREIAQVLGLPEGTVKSRLYRTRRKIVALAGGKPI